MSEAFSWVWIALGILAGLYLALLLVRHALKIVMSVVGLVATFGAEKAGERWGLAVLALGAGLAVTLALPSPARTSLGKTGRALGEKFP